MICVIATIELHSGKQPDFLRVFQELVPKVRAEQGCLEYFPALDIPTEISVQSAVRKDTVVVLEKWADLEALRQHLKAPHMMDYRTQVKAFVAGVRLQILQPA